MLTFDYIQICTLGKLHPHCNSSLPHPFYFTIKYPHTRSSVVLQGSDLLIHNHLNAFSADSGIAPMAFLFFLLSYLVDLEFCIKIFPRNPGSQLLLDNMLSHICYICIALQAPDIFRAFFRRPHRCFPPTGLSVLSAPHSLFRLTQELNPVAGLLLQSALEIPIVPRYLLFTASLERQTAGKSWFHTQRRGAFAGFDEVNRPCLRLEVARADCSVHCIGYRPKYLVVSPTVPPIT